MSISFPFERQPSEVFGTIHRPVVPAQLWSARAGRWVRVVMIVDTGADYTLLARVHAAILGVDLRKNCRRVATAGIGGTETVYLLPRLRMRLGPWSRVIPVGFLDRDDVLPLMGRTGCLDTFDVRFARRRTTFSAQRPA
ncbi:MAG: hypothetical protein E6J70_12795 [Deltaproteobacteria bacterium]|nr:MAG: hypothetical protein E6J70_12795 [Deltaproteobacteria bacterium]